MWFKNLQVYRFTRPFELTAEQLETQLEACAFTPCGSQDISRFGWTRPFGKLGHTLTHAANGQILLCARREDKILPTAVIKEALAEKVEAIEYEQGRALKKKEKEALKEELLHTLLPRAFSRTANTFAWINPADGLLMVDASSVKKADDVLALLRKSIGSLPVVPVALKNPPEITMTEWLQEGNLPASFTLEDESELRSAMEHGGIARFKQQDLMTDEVKNHLANDKLVTKLALNWGERLSFVLGDDASQYQTVPHFIPELAAKGILMLAHKPDHSCVYLGERGCTIHGKAPALCREFDCRGLVRRLGYTKARKAVKKGMLSAGIMRRGLELVQLEAV